MLITIPDVLTPEQVAHARQLLDAAEWIDGKVTAGYQSAKAKDNMQLAEGSPAAREIGEMILAALSKNPLFLAAALPLRIFPPLFNRYSGGQSFGTHVDNAIRQIPGNAPVRIRTDLSATLFFAGPEEYDGGELCVEDTYGVKKRQAPARPHGALSLHQPASRHARDTRAPASAPSSGCKA
jgi:PKHD-type hydroxylase